ncbi:unnamed protein product, partial [Vitis vinifera]
MQVSDRNGVHVPSRFMFVHFFFPLFILCFSFQYVNSLSTKTRNRNRDCDKLTFTCGFLFFFFKLEIVLSCIRSFCGPLELPPLAAATVASAKIFFAVAAAALLPMQPALDMPAVSAEPILSKDETLTRQSSFIGLKCWQWWLLVALNIFFLVAGQAAAVLLGRFYYDKGGNSKWMATFVQTAAFPILLIPLFLIPSSKEPSTTTPPSWTILASIYIALGVVLAVHLFLDLPCFSIVMDDIINQCIFVYRFIGLYLFRSIIEILQVIFFFQFLLLSDQCCSSSLHTYWFFFTRPV